MIFNAGLKFNLYSLSLMSAFNPLKIKLKSSIQKSIFKFKSKNLTVDSNLHCICDYLLRFLHNIYTVCSVKSLQVLYIARWNAGILNIISKLITLSITIWFSVKLKEFTSFNETSLLKINFRDGFSIILHYTFTFSSCCFMVWCQGNIDDWK